MENKKQVGSSSSSSSFTDLFGAKQSSPPSSSSGTFASIFPPPSSSVVGRNASCSELTGSMQRRSSGNQVCSSKQGTPDYMAKNSEGASTCVSNKERRSIFQERVEPCPLSSSLYYGGQEDMYVRSSSSQTPGSYPISKKEGEEDDPYGNNSNSASRGNWWKGSLYY